MFKKFFTYPVFLVLFLSDEYASLTYNNMPFILSPHFSKFFYKKNI